MPSLLWPESPCLFISNFGVAAYDANYDANKELLYTRLVYGEGGNDLLRFDAWMEELRKQLDDYSGLVSEHLEVMRRLTRSLHQDQVDALSPRPDDVIDSLEDLDLRVHFASEWLDRIKVAPWDHEREGVISLLELAEAVARIAEDIGPMGGEGLHALNYEEREWELRAHAWRAPRVLNAGFADAETRQALEPRQPLIAGREYDFLVDVGPRWDKIASLVTGNAEFPEYALPPDASGHFIDVLLLNEDFSPSMVSGKIWLPRNTGRSFPVTGGQPIANPGPLALRIRTPEFPNTTANL